MELRKTRSSRRPPGRVWAATSQLPIRNACDILDRRAYDEQEAIEQVRAWIAHAIVPHAGRHRAE